MFPFRCIFLIAVSVLFTGSLLAKKGGDTLEVNEEQMNTILRQTPMPDVGEGRLAKILTRYYQEGLNGPENWEKISSLRVSGRLKLIDGEYELDAYQKKPDLIKIRVLIQEREMVLAHDGEVAWQIELGHKEAKPMSDVEARLFKHSSRFGNHLLYPYAKGKKIAYIDTVPVEGTICHQIRVTLDTGYQVDYFIDIRTYLEIRVENKDLESGARYSTVYTDYIREFGMPIAKSVESYENGELVSSLTVDEVKVNSGIVPWMFKMPKK